MIGFAISLNESRFSLTKTANASENLSRN